MGPSDLLLPGDNLCFQIPPFQRPYVWNLHRAHKLVQDINKAAFEPVDFKKHWIGIVLLAKSERKCERANQIKHQCFDILDGQQRSISLRLWLVAILDEFHRSTGAEWDRISRDQLTKISVHNLDQKYWDTIHNRDKLTTDERDPHVSGDGTVLRTYWYFRWLLLNGLTSFDSEEAIELPRNSRMEQPVITAWFEKHSEKIKPVDADSLAGLATATFQRLTLSALQHEEREDKDIEEIFETLNAERTELGQFDLARNFLFIKRKEEAGSDDKAWREFTTAERAVRKGQLDLRSSELDWFLYDYLISTGLIGKGVGRHKTARLLKTNFEQITRGSSLGHYLTKDLTQAMRIWLTARRGDSKIGESSPVEIGDLAARRLMRVENVSKGPFVPLSMRILTHWLSSPDHSSRQALVEELHLMETYVFRALLAGEPFSKMRSLIMDLCVSLQDGSTTLKGWVTENAPTDERIRRAICQSCAVDGKERLPSDWILEEDIGKRADPRHLRALFDGLTEHLEGPESKLLVRKPNQRQTKKKDLEIEHFYPQTSSKWDDDLRDWGEAPEAMENRLHALGNLTVLNKSGNAIMSNKPLKKKQESYEEEKVLASKLNYKFMRSSRWGTKEIDARTKELCNAALTFWKLPDK